MAAARIYIPAMIAALALAACQLGSPARVLSLRSDTDATQMMVAIARAAQTCWFRSEDDAFGSYSMADEVNSPAGRPRLLLVPKSDPSALPVLVIQAEHKGDARSGRYTDVQTYGPILESSSGERITADVTRWAGGDDSCA